MEFVPRYEFRLCVEHFRSDYKVQRISCWDDFLTLAFAQLTYRESLRDIEPVFALRRRSSITWVFEARCLATIWRMPNQVRDWRIYGDFAPR